MVIHFEKQMAEMGGTSSFSAELRGGEEHKEAGEDMAGLRDLLTRILEKTESAPSSQGCSI